MRKYDYTEQLPLPFVDVVKEEKQEPAKRVNIVNMVAEQRLSQVLTKKLGYYVPISEIGYETIWFMKGEVDETLVPPHIIEHLAEPIIADSESFTNADGNYYLIIIIETGLPEPYKVW